MEGTLFALVELALIVGVVAWFGFSQLRALKRLDERDKRAAEEAARAAGDEPAVRKTNEG